MSFRTVLAVATLFILSGCYSYHPYQHGHPGPYGGGPPRGVLPPAGMPQGYAPNTIPLGTEPTRIDDVQGDIEEDGRVPDDYDDMEDLDDGGFGAVDGDANGEELVEYADEFVPAENEFEGGVEEFADLDDPSSGRTLTVSESDRSQTEPVEPRLNPYKHDPAYKWLRGVVQYDKQSDEWQLTYNPESDSSDEYGGKLTLTNAQVLSSIDAQPDDVILVEGEVDLDNPDGQGNPTFYVEQADVLVPEE